MDRVPACYSTDRPLGGVDNDHSAVDHSAAGVFDENDNRTFEEEEFVEMLLALFRGMAAMLLGGAPASCWPCAMAGWRQVRAGPVITLVYLEDPR